MDERRTQTHLSSRELAQRWRMSSQTLKKWRAKKYGPAWIVIPPRHVLYPVGAVEAWEQKAKGIP